MGSRNNIRLQSWITPNNEDFSVENLINQLQASGYVCSVYHYSPGTNFPAHSHNVDKIDVIIEGQFKISVKNREYILRKGQQITIPAGVIHSAEVIGTATVIAIDAEKRI